MAIISFTIKVYLPKNLQNFYGGFLFNNVIKYRDKENIGIETVFKGILNKIK